MPRLSKCFSAFFIVFFTFSLINFGVIDQADARSRSGGRSFSRSRTYRPPTKQAPAPTQRKQSSGSFRRGLAGGLMGGAIGGLLFGSLAYGDDDGGILGTELGLFHILILAGIGYFLYKLLRRKSTHNNYSGYHKQNTANFGDYHNTMEESTSSPSPPPPPPHTLNTPLDEGIEYLKRADPQFDPEHFTEVAQDVFFQVQAGWMRREISSYRHLLGDQLASEYEGHFAEMAQKGLLAW